LKAGHLRDYPLNRSGALQQGSFMKKLSVFFAMLALALGMMAVGCDNGSTGSDKTHIIQDVPSDLVSMADDNAMMGLFKVGTTVDQAEKLTNLVAGAYYSVIMPLWNVAGTKYWNGSGTYDIYARIDNFTILKASSVNFSSETTTVSYNDFSPQ
jgi:hypothetical protein